MREISIVIATRGRFDKLMNTIKSIYPPSTSLNGKYYYEGIRTHIIFDGDLDGYGRLQQWRDNRAESVIEIYRVSDFVADSTTAFVGSVAARNLILPLCNDGILWATDDIEFEPDVIRMALHTFNNQFPDDDGVVGFVQKGVSNFHPTGVGLMGQKFLQRYPGKKLFYPGYFHFACQEIYWLANKYGKFYQDPEAKLFHFHPAFHKELTDQTHIDARVHKKRDHDLIKEREAAGLIWGDT